MEQVPTKHKYHFLTHSPSRKYRTWCGVPLQCSLRGELAEEHDHTSVLTPKMARQTGQAFKYNSHSRRATLTKQYSNTSALSCIGRH